MMLIAFIVLVALAIYWPRYMLFFITVPLVGTALGGASWAVAGMINSSLVTLPSFGGFLLGGNIIAYGGGLILDREVG